MSPITGTFIAVEAVNGAAVETAARGVLKTAGRRHRGGISRWDASGIFEELARAAPEAGLPSARTLLLLYAADLAFRLRWQIQPALAEGRLVVAAPYTETAIAFGRAFGLPRQWLTALFQWAPRATQSQYVGGRPAKMTAEPAGFIEFSSSRVRPQALTPRQLVDRAHEFLQMAARRTSGTHSRTRNRTG